MLPVYQHIDVILNCFILVLLVFVLLQVGFRGKVLKSDGREMVVKVHRFFSDECDALKCGKPTISVTSIVERTAAATGISSRSVLRILKEHKNAEANGSRIETPGKKRPNRRSRKTEIDSFTAAAIKRTIYSLYRTDFLPSLLDIYEALKVQDLLKGSLWSLRKILKKLNFSYSKNSQGRSFLMERMDIVSKRFRFLRKMKELRATGRPIVYLDETWVNINHTRSKVWKSDGDKNESDFPLKTPIGKGQRFIVLHAGCSTGFIPNALLTFKSKSSKDYHEEMDNNIFKDWFVNKLLPNIAPNSIIVMDNAPYHSIEINKAPTSNSLKSHMQEWLRNRNIEFDPRATKPVLYELIKLKKDNFRVYEIDSIAEMHGHTIVRLPPYHCDFNAIELIWAQVKNDVAKHNISFKSGDIKALFDSAIRKVTPENWKRACDHVQNTEQFYWEKDGLIDEITDRLVINLEESEDENEDSFVVSDDESANEQQSDVEDHSATDLYLVGISSLPATP